MISVTFFELTRRTVRICLTGMTLALISFGQPAQPPQPPAPAPPPPPPAKVAWAGRDSYERAARELDRKQYERAAEMFGQVAERKAARADGALYWKAYALSRLGRSTEALASLADLEKTYAKSGWLNDARALAVETKQAAGQPPRPESEEDEELKLIAINGLMHSDPESAVPMLEKVLNSPKNGPRLKKRALFVLAQGRSPRSREIVTSYAKGGSNPDLQATAVEYLGVLNTPESRQALADLYATTTDLTVKRAVLRGFMIGRDKERLLMAAKSESNPDLRREALHMLGASGGHAELAQLYPGETDKNAKRAILDGLAASRKADLLVEIARKETDRELKRAAVERLTGMNSKEATAYLVELLGKDE
jgi:tetratricopeptide (TPR) repeat protein